MKRVAAVQMSSQASVADNLEVAGNLIAEAADQGASLIVLPENFAIIGHTSQDALSVQEDFGRGPIQDFLAAQATQYQAWIVGGTIPIASSQPNKVHAASLLFDDQGKVVARYDKLHLFDVIASDTEIYQESAIIEAGDHISVTDTPVGKLGLAACYDVRFPEFFKIMLNQGAEIIALPSAFTVPTGTLHWEVLVRARAIDTFSYVIAAAQTGTHSNRRQTFGNSMIVAPDGSVIAHRKQDSGVIIADIDLDALQDIRHKIPVSQHQRIICDASSLAK